MLYYSRSTLGFYDSDIHAEIPDDAVEIEQNYYLDLLAGQSEGKRIIPNAKGLPVLADQEPQSAEEALSQARIDRAAAYRAESDPLFFKFQRGEGSELDWLQKVAEIKTRIPK